MSRATEAKFDSLHLLMAETLSAEIQAYRDREEPVPPALLAQLGKFLKDNGVDSPARAEKLVDTLAASIPNFDEFDSPAAAGVPH